jgi:hypothetical protein
MQHEGKDGPESEILLGNIVSSATLGSGSERFDWHLKKDRAIDFLLEIIAVAFHPVIGIKDTLCTGVFQSLKKSGFHIINFLQPVWK